jgi:hypothetical protein
MHLSLGLWHASRLKLLCVLDSVELNCHGSSDKLREITFCIGGINERYEDYGEPPALELVLR